MLEPRRVTLPGCTIDEKTILDFYEAQLGDNGLTPRTDTHPGMRHNLYPRFSNNLTRFDEKFPLFNAAHIEGSRTVLSEGPSFNDTQYKPAAKDRFIISTLRNTLLPVKVFIAVGKTNNDAADSNPDFIDYFQHGWELSPVDFFAMLLNRAGKGDLLQRREVSQLLNKIQEAEMDFFCFPDEDTPRHEMYLDDPNNGLVIYVPQWPDHGVLSFNQCSNLTMLLLALIDPINVTHCRAGCGRSVTTLSARLAFQRGLGFMSDPNTVLEAYVDISRHIRYFKPGAMYVPEQFVLGLQMLAGMTALYLENQAACSMLTDLPFAQTVTVPQAGAVPEVANRTSDAALVFGPQLPQGPTVSSVLKNNSSPKMNGQTGVYPNPPKTSVTKASKSLPFYDDDTIARMLPMFARGAVNTQPALPAMFANGFNTDAGLSDGLDFFSSLIGCMEMVVINSDGMSPESRGEFCRHYDNAKQQIADLNPLIARYISKVANVEHCRQQLHRISTAIETLCIHAVKGSPVVDKNQHFHLVMWKTAVESHIAVLTPSTSVTMRR